MTASVNAYGNLIQITRYLAAGRSGFFSVDHKDVWEPYLTVQRPHNLLHFMRGPDEGIGLLSDIAPKQVPSLEFVYDRWPRFTHETDGLRVSLQHFIRENTVIQQYSLQRVPGEPSFRCPKFSCATRDLLIRDLEWLDPSYDFNEDGPTSPGYKRVPGIHQRSLILTHSLQPNEDYGSTSGGSKTASAFEGSSVKDTNSIKSPTRSSSDPGTPRDPWKPEAVGLVMALFINGSAVRTDGDAWNLMDCSGDVAPDDEANEAQNLIQKSLRESGKVEVTMAYRLQLLKETGNHWMSSTIPASLTDVDKALAARALRKVQFSSHPKLDFTLRRNLEHILSVCAITTSDVPIWDYQDGFESAGDELGAEQTNVYCAKDVDETEERQRGDGRNEVKEGIPDVRNLHVNDEETSKCDRVIAITCGDLSGHHIVTSASLFVPPSLSKIFD